jgi:hypothetical protein
MDHKKYPPITPEKSTSKPMGALARRAEDERIRKEEEIKKSMKVDIPLDPNIDWVIKNINGKNYLSVK